MRSKECFDDLSREIAFNRVTEEMKQQMEANKAFDYEKAYRSIDDWAYGYIDRRNLKIFLKKHKFLATNSDVVAIIRRMDLDADARLTKDEFIEGIKPEEPYSKTMKRQSSRSQKRTNTPTFKRHSRKTSVASRHHMTAGPIDGIDQLLLTENQRDPIRVQAMDRSMMSRIHSSRSPLKSRPTMRDLDEHPLKFHTPKAGAARTSRFYSLPRTPNSVKGCYSAGRNTSMLSGRKIFSR